MKFLYNYVIFEWNTIFFDLNICVSFKEEDADFRDTSLEVVYKVDRIYSEMKYITLV